MNRNTLVMLGTVSAVFILFQVPPVFAGEISPRCRQSLFFFRFRLYLPAK